MNPQLSRGLSGARQVILTGGAVVGVLCILVGIGAVLFGLRPLVFRSGSMSPTIDTGALAIAHRTDASDLRKGDIVSVPMQSGERVTHRIFAMQRDGQDVILTLKGDANDAPDLAPYRVSHADRVLFAVPKVGYLVGWLTGPLGLFFLGLYAAFLLSVIVRRPADPSPGDGPGDGTGTGPGEKPRQPGGRRRAVTTRRGSADRVAHHTRRVVVPAVALTFVAGTVAQVWALPTLAAWTDAGGVSGTVLTGYTVPAPDQNTCTVITPGTTSVRGVKLSWPATTSPLPPLSYTTPTFTGITPITNSVALVGSDQVLTQTYNPNTAANKNKIVTVTDRAFATGSATWLSPVATWKYLTGGSSTIQPVCGEVDPPDVAFVAPDATSRTVANEKTFITSACTTSTVIACGTYLDANTVTVTYTLKRVVSGVTKCWTGSWTNPQTGGVCTTLQSAATATVSGVTTWYETASQSTVYASSGGAGAYTLTVNATDSWQNVTTEILNFTLT